MRASTIAVAMLGREAEVHHGFRVSDVIKEHPDETTRTQGPEKKANYKFLLRKQATMIKKGDKETKRVHMGRKSVMN